MPLSPKQQAALNKAAPSARKAMLKGFQAQAAPVRKARTQPTASVARAPAAKPLRRQVTHVLPNYLDPMCKEPMPASLSDGKALAHTSLISKDFKLRKYEMVQVGNHQRFPGPTVLLVTNTGGTATVGVLVETNIVESGTLQYLEYGIKQEIFNIPTLSGSDVAGHPTAGRAMKFGVSVINNTNALKRGGRVTYLNTFQRLPDVQTTGTAEDPQYYWDAIIGAIKAAPDRRRINGDNLVAPKQLVGAIVDNVRYHEFKRWKPTESKAGFLDHVLDRADPTGPTLAVLPDAPRPMTTVAFVFDPTDDAQDYSVTIRASFYTRWPLTSVPGQSMSRIPTASAEHIIAVTEHNVAKAGELVTMAAGGATTAAVVGPRLAAARAPDAGGLFRGAAAMRDRIAALAGEAAEAEAAVGAELVPILAAAAL